MDVHGRMSGVLQSWRRRGQEVTWGGESELGDVTAGIGRGLTGRSIELTEVQEEVAAESRGRVLVVGRSDVANRGLLGRLRQEDALPAGGPVYREGFFTVVTLDAEPPKKEPGGWGDGWLGQPGVTWWPGELEGADALLYVVDSTIETNSSDARWHGRLRALGAPLIVVLWATGDAPPDVQGLAALLHLPPSARPLVVTEPSSQGAARRGDGSRSDDLLRERDVLAVIARACWSSDHGWRCR